ncbi:hypothetical protein FMM74_016370 [Lachnospiraceae bacterium MD308]|nr:hypothetical protein [Lachnospiraceae bacterium MD308]
MESFVEYMWYLLTTPFKLVKKSVNQWYIFCKVFGKRFDEVHEDIMRARDEGMVAACCDDMLRVHGADRGLARYDDEDIEDFRIRIAMYEEVCALGGLNAGIILAVSSLGYENVSIKSVPEYTGDTSRWAEFIVFIRMEADKAHPSTLPTIKKTVRKWKAVGAKDNYLFDYHIVINEIEKTEHVVQYYEDMDYYDYDSLDGTYLMDGQHFLDSNMIEFECCWNREEI